MTGAEILELQRLVRRVPVAEPVMAYALRPGARDPAGTDGTLDFIEKWVACGAGPRAAQYLILGAKARAVTRGRYHVSLDDVRAVAHPVLRHRVLTNFHAESEGVKTDQIVDRLLDAVPAPKSGM